MNLIKKFVTGLGNQTAPFGFAPEDPEAGYKAGLGYIGDVGANLLANNQGGVDPFANLGASLQRAKASGTQRNKEQYTAQRLMEEAQLKRQEREQEAARKQQMEEAISQLPPGQQALARLMPDKFFGNQVDSMFGSADGPTSVQEYNTAKAQGYGGTYMDFLAFKKPGGTTVTNILPGQIPDTKLREGLDKAEGDLWVEYKKAGAVSGQNAQDFAVLDELLQLAPQGPITGRLAAAFPGASSAADAVQSIVKRIAPTMRAPGSGSTSDIEYQGMLQSLPALANQPEANMMILSIMKAKADLNVQRSDIITAYQTGQMDASTARKEIAKLDRVSIMTPEMKRAILGISGSASERGDLQIPPPDGWDEEDWKYLTPEEQQEWLGQ
jgi:hypothetical protein